MNRLTEAALTILMAIIGVAILAVLVDPKANTTGVIQAFASGFGNDLSTAEGPASGTIASPTLSYPSMGYGM
jgi:hypothetical protein